MLARVVDRVTIVVGRRVNSWMVTIPQAGAARPSVQVVVLGMWMWRTSINGHTWTLLRVMGWESRDRVRVDQCSGRVL